MSLYPSLEDMQMDKMITVQQQAFTNAQLPAYTQNPYPELHSYTQSTSVVSNGAIMYPDLADFMGLELSQQVIAANMPEYLSSNRTAQQSNAVRFIQNIKIANLKKN